MQLTYNGGKKRFIRIVGDDGRSVAAERQGEASRESLTRTEWGRTGEKEGLGIRGGVGLKRGEGVLMGEN